MKKNNKSSKVPFYLKPFQKVLEQSTNLTLSYLYDYSCKYYGEILSYDDWLVKVQEFMKNYKNLGD